MRSSVQNWTKTTIIDQKSRSNLSLSVWCLDSDYYWIYRLNMFNANGVGRDSWFPFNSSNVLESILQPEVDHKYKSSRSIKVIVKGS